MILVAGPDPKARTVARVVLERAGHDVEETDADPVAVAVRRRPEVLVLDFGADSPALGPLDGIPVLALTTGGAGERTAALRAGAADCLTRPFDHDELVARAEALMRRPRAATTGVVVPGATTIGGYLLVELIGSGGMGEVYRAEHSHLGRDAAVKLMRSDYLAEPTLRARFLREFKMTAALKHPNIVTVYDAGEEGGRLYLAMELLEGEDLARRIDRGPLTPEETAAAALQVGSALDAAHARGLVHRDMKPENVIVADGHAYVTDFGLAKWAESDTSLTGVGGTVGTARYLAPEQIRGGELGPWTDVYSFGCVAYECLAGRPPFTAESEMAVLWAHVNERPPALPGVPAPVADAVMRALAKAPADRWPSAGEFAAALAAPT